MLCVNTWLVYLNSMYCIRAGKKLILDAGKDEDATKEYARVLHCICYVVCVCAMVVVCFCMCLFDNK